MLSLTNERCRTPRRATPPARDHACLAATAATALAAAAAGRLVVALRQALKCCMSQRQGDTGCVGGQLSHQSSCLFAALARRARRGQHAPTCKRLDSSLSCSKSRRRRRTLQHVACTRDRRPSLAVSTHAMDMLTPSTRCS